MRISYLTLLCTLILCSCGREYDNSRTPSSTLGTGLEQFKVLQGEERSIAYNICFELLNKNMNWRQKLLLKTFVFDVQEQTCDSSSVTSKTVSAKLQQDFNSTPMTFYPASGESLPFDQVITHLHGDLAPVCNELLKGATIGSVIVAQDGSQKQFKFFKKSADGFDGFKVDFVKADEKIISKYILYKISLDAVGLPSSDYKGLEVSIDQTESCPNSATTSSTKQTFKP